MVFWTLFTALVKIKPVKVTRNLFSKPGLELCPCKYNACSKFSTSCIIFKLQSETLTSGFDQSKARIILSLNFKSADDSVPFYKLPIKQLVHIQKITKNDERNKFCENRLYYISSKIKCPPSAVSEKLAKRTFVYNLSFDWLEKSLHTLLEKGVTGDRILRDLWVLKYNHKTINNRLQTIKDMGVNVLYPWMVRCSPAILERYISLTQETKNILGESRSTQMYLAERLNISMDAVEDMWAKMPALRTIRVTKIKKFLDFLIKEGFTVEDIANRPRVLASSQITVKYRLDRLRNLGLNDVNLNSLCRSRKNFQKYYESLEAVMKDCNNSTGRDLGKL